MLRLLQFCCLLLVPLFLKAQHPNTFLTANEAKLVKQNIGKYPLLKQSYADIKSEVDQWLGKTVDVPLPKDAAGGYTHDKHKYNYTLIFNSGLLYQLTGDTRYATLVKNVLLQYAALNPTLKKHPQATSSSPGRIFWQALNDANWLVYAAMAYDMVYQSMSAAERKTIADGAFKPEVDFITKEMPEWFNLIHNHAVWACAGVGMAGIATDNKDWVDMAMYGSTKDGKSGFLALMDGLFSPDGYYTEGPYYVRYALLPYYVFATAIDHARPQLKIFKHRNSILGKALEAALQQTNLDGRFFAYNDALKEKDYTSNELVTAIDKAYEVYGQDSGMLFIAKKQGRVMLNKGGVAIAAALATGKAVPGYFPYRSQLYRDGAHGDEGGVSILRTGNGRDLSSLIFKYSSHGLSHGHYDKLNINFFDKGNEILTDYGAVRFIGVEQKYGGRYLTETKSFAAQTITHNTIVADEKSDYGGKESLSEKHHPVPLFNEITGKVQASAALDSTAYPGIRLTRSVFLLEPEKGHRLIIDLCAAASAEEHQYDLPFHYNGQLISTTIPYKAYTTEQKKLGDKNGYQHYFTEACGQVKDSMLQLTLLNNSSYYTISSYSTSGTEVFFTRSGAGDPDFNLRHEPMMLLRKKAKDVFFVNLLEVHGNFDPIAEFSTSAYSAVTNIKILRHDAHYSIAEITLNGQALLIMQSNDSFEKGKTHLVSGYRWQGPFAVFYKDKQIQ